MRFQRTGLHSLCPWWKRSADLCHILHRDLNSFVEATQYLVCAIFQFFSESFQFSFQFLHLETIVRPSLWWKTVQCLVSFLVCAEFRFCLSLLLLSSRFSSLHLETIVAETLILCGGQRNTSFRFSFLLEFQFSS